VSDERPNNVPIKNSYLVLTKQARAIADGLGAVKEEEEKPDVFSDLARGQAPIVFGIR
jgi:hypothetical protein